MLIDSKLIYRIQLIINLIWRKKELTWIINSKFKYKIKCKLEKENIDIKVLITNLNF